MIFTIGHSNLKEQPFATLMGKTTTLIDVRSHPGSRAQPQFNQEAMRSWLPQHGKGYEWWPGLGGWDVRHMPLAQKYLPHVDIAGYSKGAFPKHIIGGNRLDHTTIVKQIETGCSCSVPQHIAALIREYLVDGNNLDASLSPYLEILTKQMKADIRELKKPAAKRKVQKRKNSDQLELSLAPPGRDVTGNCPQCSRTVIAPQWLSKGLWDYSWFSTTEEFMRSLKLLISRGEKEDVAICCSEACWWKCHRSMISDCLHYLGVECAHIDPSGKIKPHASAIGNRIQRYPDEVVSTWKLLYAR